VANKDEEAPLVIEALQQPLLEALNETAPQSPVKNEDLAWRPFVLVVVYSFLAGIKSGRCLLTHLPHADPSLGLPNNVKKSTFFDAFRRFSATQGRQLFYALLARIAFFPVPEMAALGVLCAVDGSHWPALFRMNWAAVGSNKPTVLLHLAFGLNQMIPVAMLLTESNSSERKALRQILQSGVTYVADRGYFAYYLLKDISAASAFFVIRAPCNVTYQILERLPVTLPSGMNWLLDVQDQNVFCDKEEDSGTWRMVRFVIGNSEFVLFSNRWDLSTWQIIIIYAYRWQIELFFLFIKRTLNGLHLLTHSKNGLQIQFYLMLVAALLLLHFKQRNEAATTEDAPRGEPVQVPSGSGSATEQPESNRQTTSCQEESEEQRSVDEEEAAQTATETREEAEHRQQATTSQGAKAEPARGKTEAKRGKAEPASSKAPPEKSTRQATIEDKDNAMWYQDLGNKLRTFWRISIHWLQTLRDNLARVWHPAIFLHLAGYAKPSK
jgi:hypothetical protein